MEKYYRTFEDIDQDLKRLDLERHIALEEMKLQKNKIKEDLNPNNWWGSAFGIVRKYGFYLVLRKFIK